MSRGLGGPWPGGSRGGGSGWPEPPVSLELSLTQRGTQNLPDVITVLGTHTERVTAVVLAAERTGVTQFESPPDDGPVVDDAVLQGHGRRCVRARLGVFVTHVVLDVPEVRVRQHL